MPDDERDEEEAGRRLVEYVRTELDCARCTSPVACGFSGKCVRKAMADRDS